MKTAQIILQLLQTLISKCNEHLSSILIFISLILGVRFVYVTWGFDICSIVVAVLLFVYSYIIDMKREMEKNQKNKRSGLR